MPKACSVFELGLSPSELESVKRKLARYTKKTDSEEDCWTWTRSLHNAGYGKVYVKLGYACFYTHRLTWELSRGTPIPDGLLVRHKCDNPPCCNPNHLETGTHKDNSQDMHERKRVEHLKGELHPCVSITNAQVLDIRIKYHSSEGRGDLDSLAKEYGINRVTIHRIISGERWKDVGGPTTPVTPLGLVTTQDEVEILRMGREGLSAKRIGEILGFKKTAIGNRLTRFRKEGLL